MKNSLKNWWLVLLKGIILILLSFSIFGHPISALVGLSLYIGIGLIATGLILIFSSISIRKEDDQWGWKLTEGIVDLIFGYIFLSNPGITATVFPFVVGFWMIFYGIMIFSSSFSAKSAGVSSWWLNLILGILTVILGYMISSNLIIGAVAITTWIGAGFLLFGIVNVSIALDMRKMLKKSKG